MKKVIASILLLLAANIAVADPLTDAVANEDRPLKQRVRDEFRNPQQTLRFFDVQSDMTVVEIWPGGGWYANILAPMLKEKGQFYAAHFFVDENTKDYYRKAREGFEAKVVSHPLIRT